MALSSHPICYVSQLLGLPSQRLTVLQRPVQVLSFETGFQHDHSILNARCGSCLSFELSLEYRTAKSPGTLCLVQHFCLILQMSNFF